MTLSTLVTPTVSSLSHLSKSFNSNLELWSLHALLLTIEAAGLSYISQVQIIRLCPDKFFEVEAFVVAALEFYAQYLAMILRSGDGSSQECSSNTLISELSVAYEMMACRMKNKVQMLGIHVLKTYSQRELTEGPQTKTHSFMMIFGELLGNVFSVMQATLKKCSSKESVNMIDECLKLLFLFHTLSQSKKYQQDATILLLDALMIVCYLSSDSGSQEELAPSSHVADIRDGSMSGNVISTSEAEGHPDNVDTNPESFEGESAVS